MPALCDFKDADRIDAEDQARVLMMFRGQPREGTPLTSNPRRRASLLSSAYVVDPESGLAYLLD